METGKRVETIDCALVYYLKGAWEIPTAMDIAERIQRILPKKILQEPLIGRNFQNKLMPGR